MTDLLTIAETRRVLNVSATTLWRWEQIGLIQRLPGTRRFTRAEVDRVLQWQSGPRTPEERKRGAYRTGRGTSCR